METKNQRHERRHESGFNLIELMIVMVVIALLIAVSGYAWQVMIRRGNEAAAVAYVNKINTAQAYYASKHGGIFAPNFRSLIENRLLDKTFDEDIPFVDGYRFKLHAENSTSNYYSINADPVVGSGVRATGTTHYFLDSSIHSITFTDDNRPAKPSDPSL